MNQAGRFVVVLLRLSAAMMAFALIAVFMPGEWIDATHRWLGMGDFPAQPISYYLARSLSAFYVIFGGLLWLISVDLERYRNIGFYVCYAGLAFGPIVLFIDISAGMPFYWTLIEGPFAIILSVVLLTLLKKARLTDQ